MLVLAKMAGACGIIKSMTAFQESTKLPGGDEFIARFMQLETARLNVSLESYLKTCVDSVAMYNAYFGAVYEPTQ